MKPTFYILTALFLFLSGQAQNALAIATQTAPPDTIRDRRGNIAEIIDGKYANGLLRGTHKIFRRGDLLEERIFDSGKKEGVIKTYYNYKTPIGKDTTAIASIVPVKQKMIEKNGKKQYAVEILPYKTVKGFHKASQVVAYEYTLDSSLTLTARKGRPLYPDPFLVFTNKAIKDLNTEVTYYNKDGQIEYRIQIRDGRPNGLKKTYYPNKQVRSEGRIEKGRTGEFRSGRWLFYYENGLIEREEYYHDGSTSRAYLEPGTLIDTARYYFDDRRIKLVIAHPSPKDFYHRIDTVEIYYPNGNIKMRYDESKKARIFRVGSEGDTIQFDFSGMYEEFYKNGKLKVHGYYCKIPRRQLTKDEVADQKNRFVTKHGTKKVGFWYFISKDGEITDIKEYRLNGQLKQQQPSEKDIQKESQRYKRNPEEFQFRDWINDNE